jgi:hypothetical protein
MNIKNPGRRWITFALLIVCAWIFSPAYTFAENSNTGTIMGFVYDKDGKTPLDEARVLLKKVKSKKGEKEYKSEPTPETGDYKMENIPEGKYKAAIVVKSGKIYQTRSVIEIFAGKTVIRSFHLAPKRPFFAFFYEPCGIAMIIGGTWTFIEIIKKKSPDER